MKLAKHKQLLLLKKVRYKTMLKGYRKLSKDEIKNGKKQLSSNVTKLFKSVVKNAIEVNTERLKRRSNGN